MAGLTNTSSNKAVSTTGPAILPHDPEGLRQEVLRTVGRAKSITDDALDAGRELTDAEHGELDELMVRAEGLSTRMKDATDRAKAKAGPSSWPPSSKAGEHGSNFASADDLREILRVAGGSGGVSTKAMRGAQWGAKVVEACSDGIHYKGLTSSGTVLVPIPAPEPIEMGRPVTSLRSLIPVVQSDGQFTYLRQTERTNAAAPVAPGDLKPTSKYTFVKVDDHCRVVAHLSEPLTRMDLSDAPLLADFVRTEMFFGLEQAIEAEVLLGTGLGEHMLGLSATPGILTSPRIGTSDLGILRTLRRAITRLEAQGLVGGGWILNPADYEAVEMAATSDEALILNTGGQSLPIDRAARRLFGIPVVSTPACPLGTAFLGDWSGSTRIYEREAAILSWSESVFRPDAFGPGLGASDFSRNLVSARAETRVGFAVLRPSGVVKISLT